MPLSTDISRLVIRQNRELLGRLNPGERVGAVNKIVKKYMSLSQDELISVISPSSKTPDPELQKTIDRIAITNRMQSIGVPEPQVQEMNRKLASGEISEQELQGLGVLTREKLPSGNIDIGFGFNQEESLSNVLTKYYSEKLGQQTDVTVFKRGSDLLYIDPVDGRVILANASGVGAVGEALPVVGDIAGTIGGGIIGGKKLGIKGAIASESIGSSVGTGVFEFLRLLTGKAFGVHDRSIGDMLKKSGYEGAKAGAITATTGGLFSAVKAFNNFRKGLIYNKEEAIRSGMTNTEADAVINEMNRILGDKKFALTKGKKGTDVVAQSAEAELRSTTEHAQKFKNRDVADETAILSALNKITSAGVERKGTGLVGEVAGRQVNKRLRQARSVVAASKLKFQSAIDNLGKTVKEEVGEPTRQFLTKAQVVAKNSLEKTWQKVRETGGFNESTKKYNIPIPEGSGILKRKKIINRQIETATTGIVPQTKRKIVGIEKKGVIKKKQDLADYNDELAILRKQQRIANKNQQFGDIDTKALGDFISIMEGNRRIQLVKAGKVKLLNAIESAEKKTARFHEAYNRSFIGDMTAKNDKGVFVIKSKNFVDTVLRGSGDDADQLLRIIGGKPPLMAKWKEGIADAYKRDVIDKIKPLKGQVSDVSTRAELRDKTTKWIGKNKDMLTRFFSENEIKNLSKTGDLAVLVRKQVNQMKRVVREANDIWGKGKLKSLDPEELVRFVTNSNAGWARVFNLGGIQSSVQKIKYVKNITKNYPAAWREFQDDFLSGIRKQMLDVKTGKVDLGKISTMVENNAEQIIEIAGKDYYKNLVTINNAKKLFDKAIKKLGPSEAEAGIIQAIRGGIAPPLTRKGRVFTALLIFNKKSHHKTLADIMLDPGSMQRLASLAEHNGTKRQALELATSLGFIHGEDE